MVELSETDSCMIQTPGDANGNVLIDIADYVFLLNFVTSGGPAPIPLANGDFTGDCIINIVDVNELIESITIGVGDIQITD